MLFVCRQVCVNCNSIYARVHFCAPLQSREISPRLRGINTRFLYRERSAERAAGGRRCFDGDVSMPQVGDENGEGTNRWLERTRSRYAFERVSSFRFDFDQRSVAALPSLHGLNPASHDRSRERCRRHVINSCLFSFPFNHERVAVSPRRRAFDRARRFSARIPRRARREIIFLRNST